MLPRRILVIHLNRVGDILLTTPAVSYLRRLFGQAQIDFLVDRNFRELLEGNPDLTDVLIFPKKQPWQLPGLVAGRRYDWVVDFLANGSSAWACLVSGAPVRAAFHNNYPGLIHNLKIQPPGHPMYAALLKLHLIYGLCQKLGITAPQPVAGDCGLKLNLEPGRKELWKEVLERSGYKQEGRPLVMLSPQSRRVTRQWRPGGFAETARELIQKHRATVVCLWGPEERETALEIIRQTGHPDIRIAPEFKNLKDLAAYISHADCLITNCNGAKHIAVAAGVATVTIHMSSNPIAWNPPGADGGPWHSKHPIARLENLHCIGCQKNVCPYSLECSKDLPASAVTQAVTELLSNIGVAS
ncbi:MAG: glycosyltransferase family 9 protein [Elusimicrobia bacterium]|nr:glycosyltransferase family 9 protein [Elusimicrobiota bacterium]